MQQDFKRHQLASAIQDFDLLHQLYRLRQSKDMTDAEVELIVRTIMENVRSYDQIVEVRPLRSFRA